MQLKHFLIFDKTLIFAENKSYIIIDFSIADDAGNELFYYTFKEEVLKDGEENKTIRNYEIDFLLSRKDKICPIEVKSSGYNSHKSLDKFQQKFSERILHRYLLYTKDLKKDTDIFCLPVYMTELL